MLALPPGSVSGFNIMAAPDSIASVAANIESTMGYPYYALTMYDMYPNIFAWIELQKKPIPIVLGLIVIVAAFNIVATMLMIVLEKTHTIGILKTLGATAGECAVCFSAGYCYQRPWSCAWRRARLGVVRDTANVSRRDAEKRYLFYELGAD